MGHSRARGSVACCGRWSRCDGFPDSSHPGVRARAMDCQIHTRFAGWIAASIAGAQAPGLQAPGRRAGGHGVSARTTALDSTSCGASSFGPELSSAARSRLQQPRRLLLANRPKLPQTVLMSGTRRPHPGRTASPSPPPPLVPPSEASPRVAEVSGRGAAPPGRLMAGPTGSADRRIRRAIPVPLRHRGSSNVVPLLLCFPRFRAQRRPAVVAGAAAKGRRCR